MHSPPRIGILVVAYNAATTLRSVLDRIPEEFRPRITAILISDDHSGDDTYGVGLETKRDVDGLPITVVRQPRNLGYGGNQKFGYTWAIDHGLDIVVMLHGDGQYAPECLADVVAPIERDEADVVLGSRMMDRGGARAGGMPLYKLLGNRLLTTFQNSVSGLVLTEWHSGYRAFATDALARIPFVQNSDGFDFDTEVLLQLHDVGARVAEVPIPTYYGDEICYVEGIPYAWDVVVDVLRYRLQRIGFGSDSLATASSSYERKPDEQSSHSRLLSVVRTRGPGRVLDVGCAEGLLAEEMRQSGHHVTGIDVVASPEVKERVDRFVEANLDAGLPSVIREDERYDVIVAADVLEHVRQPLVLLQQLHEVLAPGGALVVSVPNFGHWYPRLRVALGRFDYDRRGILDEDHVRFFTRRSFERLLHRSGWHIVRREAVGLPFDVADRGGGGEGLGAVLKRSIGWLDRLGLRARPTLFGYQLLYDLEPARGSVDSIA
ncbi:MAG: bifunctional glycosyltransferase/class I SAM-dependent methyltransferase [Acidimicrobiales bacterium]